jgi:DNA-binding winged helix-turn-helix (wHTH) protein
MDDEVETFLLDMATRELLGSDGPIHIEPKVFDLIVLLAGCPRTVVDRRTIAGELWPNESVCDGALRQCVWSARRALGDSAKPGNFIRTLHRRGYLFVGRVAAQGRTALLLSSSTMARSYLARRQITRGDIRAREEPSRPNPE